MSKLDQVRWADEHGLQHDAGYCDSPGANMPWLTETIRSEIKGGDGGEFGKPGERPRIAALHSSAALAVNFFGYWTVRDPAPLQFALQLESAIERIQFEAKFPTPVGPRAPNLDVVLHLADGSLFAIESKFTEWLGCPGHKPLRDAYFADGRKHWSQAGLPGAQAIAETFAQERRFKHLDVSQLLKHMLGLASQPRPWRLMLLWYEEPIIQSGMLRAEATRFRTRLADGSRYFSSMEYQRVWHRLAEKLSSDDRGYANYMTARYFSARSGPGPTRAVSKAVQDRIDNECEAAGREEFARFMRDHGGMTPIQYALAQFPQTAKVVAEESPHLIAPALRKPSKE